jgi:hypothetical protein
MSIIRLRMIYWTRIHITTMRRLKNMKMMNINNCRKKIVAIYS